MSERVSARAIYDLLIEHKRPGDGLPDPLDACLLVNAAKLYEDAKKCVETLKKDVLFSEEASDASIWSVSELSDVIELCQESVYGSQ